MTTREKPVAEPEGTIACAVCGSLMGADMVPETFKCCGCGFFSSRLPVRINAADRIDENARERALKAIRVANYRQLLTECADIMAEGGSLLDVGCAHGWFMEAATARRMICLGIEPDRGMSARAKAAGHNVTAGFFPDDMPPGVGFDVITFNDVFEHLPDVNGIVDALPTYLRPGGAVIVQLPVADGLIFRMARLAARIGLRGPLDRLWQRGLPSPHLSYFTVRTLTLLFERAGYSLVKHGQLQSIAKDGLYERIRYDKAVGPIKARALYAAARTARPLTGLFPSDIQYFAFRRLASK